MGYTVKKGKILSETGIPYLPRWFCDDLVCFEADKYGVSKVEYFNQKTRGSEPIFIDDMWGGMRFYINDNSVHKSQVLSNCCIMPYGFTAHWEYKDSLFLYEQRVVNNTICARLLPIRLGNEELSFSVEFYDAWRLTPHKNCDLRYYSGVERKWNEWNFDNGMLTANCIDGGVEGTYITLSGNVKLNYQKRSVVFCKHILTTEKINENSEIIFVMAFDTGKEMSEKRAYDTISNYEMLVKQQDLRYEKVIEKMPVLESPYKSLNNFFALVPLYSESCKVLSLPGGIHAKTEHYWIWGWDGMTSSFAYAYWGDTDFVCEMLKMYMETADPKKGIGHFFARDMSHIETSPIPAQGLYISLLYQYYANGRDITPYYNFAKKIFELICSAEVNNSGFCEGFSLYPDFRNAIDETGHDISTFNNSSLYCALRAMTILAEAMDDFETYNRAYAMAEKLKEKFADILFDDNKGYFVASADSNSLEKRDVYTSMSIKWDNLFCKDLLEGKEKRLLKFFEENFICESGIMPVSVQSKVWDADANQLHCYWPVTGECYTRLINFENRKDLIEKFIGWVSCWTDILMCPEGIDCYDNINEPKTDCWNAVNGAWYGNSMRAWYEAVIHSVVGIDFSHRGMNIYPYSGEELNLKNLNYNGKIFDICMKGSGANISDVILNGKSLGRVKNISMDKFEKNNTIEIIRC